jgi:hypothetical protein
MKIPITSSIIRLDGPGFFVLGIGGGDGRGGGGGSEISYNCAPRAVPPLLVQDVHCFSL